MGFFDGFSDAFESWGKTIGGTARIVGDIARLDFEDAAKHTIDVARYTKLDKAMQIGTQAITGGRGGQMPGREKSPQDLARQARLDALQQIRSGGARGSGSSRAILSGSNGTSRSNQQLMVGR